MVDRVEIPFLYELPESLDKIQVGRVWRKKQEFYAEGGGELPDAVAGLVSGIVQNDGYRHANVSMLKLHKQLANRPGVYVVRVFDMNHLLGDRVQGP